ncbi:hypothetical protein GCM10017711_14630 [Paeniglutamicibacter sulfureus]
MLLPGLAAVAVQEQFPGLFSLGVLFLLLLVAYLVQLEVGSRPQEEHRSGGEGQEKDPR